MNRNHKHINELIRENLESQQKTVHEGQFYTSSRRYEIKSQEANISANREQPEVQSAFKRIFNNAMNSDDVDFTYRNSPYLDQKTTKIYETLGI